MKRFVRKLRGPQRPQPAGIILTAPGEEGQVDKWAFQEPIVNKRAWQQVLSQTEEDFSV